MERTNRIKPVLSWSEQEKGDDFLYNGKIDASVGLIEADDQVIPAIVSGEMLFAEFVKGFVQVRFVVDHSKMFPDKDLSVPGTADDKIGINSLAV